MPYVEVNGTRLFYEEHGEGDEVVVLSHGFLMNHHMFDGQIEALSRGRRVIAFDHRGHGRSAPIRERIDIYTLMEDAAALVDELVGGPVHFMGMSTGGYVALRLMVKRPDLLKSVALIDTAAGDEPPSGRRQYDAMLFVARWFGLRPVFSKAIAILMGEPFRTDPARRDEYEWWRSAIFELDRQSIYHFGKAIFHRDSVLDAIRGSSIPARVVVGELDVPTPLHDAESMVAALERAELTVIPGAGHSSPVERPEEVASALADFLEGL